MEIQSRTFEHTEETEYRSTLDRVDGYFRQKGEYLGKFPLTATRAYLPDQEVDGDFYKLFTRKGAPVIMALYERIGFDGDKKILRTLYVVVPEYCDQEVIEQLKSILGPGSQRRPLSNENQP